MQRLFGFWVFLTMLSLHMLYGQDIQPGKALPGWEPGMLDLHHINTGRGNAAFYIFPDGTTMVLDAGEIDPSRPRTFSPRCTMIQPNYSKRPFEWIADYIWMFAPKGKATQINYALISHFHDDHFGHYYHGAPLAPNGKYYLTGITGLGDMIPIETLIDRGYPDYADPFPMRGEEIKNAAKSDPFIASSLLTMENYWNFIDYQVREKGMKAEALKVGRKDQIRLLNSPAQYPTFAVYNIKSNGTFWTGKGEETFNYFGDLSKIAPLRRPGENPCSNAIRINYGKFTYFNGGDMPGDTSLGQPFWNDVETPAIPAIGEVDVTTLNHHGNRDSHNERFVRGLKARVYVHQVWSSDHPGHEVLRRLTSQHLYTGPRDLFATNMLQPNIDVIGPSLANSYKSMDGHILVRVMPGGDQYYVIILDDATEVRLVTKVFGPYASKIKP